MTVDPSGAAQRLQHLVDLVVAPNQTQEKSARGDIHFAQTGEAVNCIAADLVGAGGLSYNLVRILCNSMDL